MNITSKNAVSGTTAIAPEVKIDESLCIGCGKCVKDCISQCIKLADGKAAAASGRCIFCGHCVAVCPRAAVSIAEYEMEDVEEYESESFTLQPENVLHSIKFRRSIRDYKQQSVEQEKLENILQAGRYTATAKNNQGSCFIFVQEELDTLKKLVWDFIEKMGNAGVKNTPREDLPYISFNRRRKSNPADDYLFRNAPVVVFVTSEWPLDAGLAAQNMETMAVAQGLGVLYNGFLARIADENDELKAWLGIEGKMIKACMLLGYPKISYERTAPRRKANAIWK
jgi:nitroreductase/ferredoxin